MYKRQLLRCGIDGSAFVCRGQGYTVAMPGRHQLQNAMTALRTVDALRLRGWEIPVEAAVRGLARARMQGRLERVVDQPLVLLDGAHNEAGIEALCQMCIRDRSCVSRAGWSLGMLSASKL